MGNKKLIIIATVLMIVLSGCVGNITQYEASKASVSNETLNTTGFELVDTQDVYYNDTINVSEQQVNISVLSYATIYEKENEGDLVPRSAYASLSTPSVSPGGIELNPTVTNPTDEIIKEINKRNEDFRFNIDKKVGEINLTHDYNNNTTVEKYEAKIDVKEADATVDAYIYSGVVSSSDSVIVMAGMIPTAVDDQESEEQKILEMMKSTKTR